MREDAMKKRILQIMSLLLLFTTVVVTPVMAQKPSVCSKEEWEVLKLTNQKRLNLGLEPLSTTKKLQKAAGIRVAETESYFSHTRPDGTTCFSVLAEQDIFYRSVAENIAAGQSSAEQVINSWWNSPGHKQNMMNASLTHLGVGYSQDTNGYFRHYWVQLFVGGCQFESLSVKGGTDLSVKKGSTISDMDLYLVADCKWHGNSYVPISDKMCSGYNKNKTGKQTVTVSYQKLTTTFTVTVTGTGETTSDQNTQKKAVCLKWKKVANADGYVIYRATSKNGKYQKIKTIQKGRITGYTDKKVKTGKKYYYKVKSFQKKNNKLKLGKTVRLRSQKWVKL
ncbi:MAG TPA: hypothetical protein DFH99_05710 [Roseburia sp.]|nr:hypothetical protein [Roseburia sp.]HCX41921.1 hypothetical protein [Lachnospiraceae bacterium]